MSLNIIVKKGSGGKVSDGEVAESLAKRVDREQAVEKAGYKDRMRRIRANAKNNDGNNMLRPTAVYDMATLIRHEQQNPGCTSDPTYMREFRRDNPECNL
jgi:hypothetical protein